MRLIILSILFCVPILSHAEVMFSEIAWMGTQDNANDEWIEIYNFSDAPTDLAGWTITDGNTLSISLSGIMPPHGVFLLERTDDTTVPNVTASIVYTGALSNAGATLTIKDANGNAVDTLIGGENWERIGGDNEKKYTAQRTSTGDWVTGTPTPGAQNIETNASDLNQTEAQTSSVNKGGGGGPAKRTPVVSVDLSSFDHTLALVIDAPDIAYVNQLVDFTFTPSGAGETLMQSLKTYWNFGDTYTSENREPSHIFAYPGEYIVVLEAWYGEQHAATYHTITVLPVTLSLGTTSDGDVLIQSNSLYEVDIGGYILEGAERFVFPKNTILPKRGTLTVSKNRIGGSTQTLTLHDTERALLASTASTKTPRETIEVPELSLKEEPPALSIASNPVSLVEEIITEPTVTEEDDDVIVIGNTKLDAPDKEPEKTIPNQYGMIAILVVATGFLVYLRK